MTLQTEKHKKHEKSYRNRKMNAKKCFSKINVESKRTLAFSYKISSQSAIATILFSNGTLLKIYTINGPILKRLTWWRVILRDFNDKL